MANKNPFSPTFGASPPRLAGRDHILAAIEDALDTGITHPDYSTLLIGARGTGKTVMLEAIETQTRTRGWLTISETAFPKGLNNRIASQATALLKLLNADQPRWRIAGIQAASIGVTVERPADAVQPLDLRSALTALGDMLKMHSTGLIITIDELQAGDINEVREFGSIFQHVSRREGRPIAFVGAALPSIEDSLLAGDTATFLQRCSIYEIGRLTKAETRDAIAKPIYDHNAQIVPDALEVAVSATLGYPFMVQLVGFHSWKVARDPDIEITRDDVFWGIVEAEKRVGRLVLWPTWKELSEVDRNFLIAMTADQEESKLADIADRLNVTISYAGVYRHRLIKAGMITAAGKSKIAFTHPATRKWILALTDTPEN